MALKRWPAFLAYSLAGLCFVGLILFLIFMHGSQNESAKESLSVQLLPESFASASGAFCLDGSPPAFYIRGNESTNSWILFLQGGAWCVSVNDCKKRSRKRLGSSRHAPTSLEVKGFLSSDCQISPDYCQWNLVVFHYCDGASFLGNASESVVSDSGSLLHLRGARVFISIIEHLMITTHLAKAENIVLAGYSAGGVGALVHADQLHTNFFPSVASFKVIVDAAMFVDIPDVNGHRTMADIFQAVYSFHSLNASNSLQDCINSQAADKGWQCLLPDVFHTSVTSPLFFTNSVFDTWMIPNALKSNCLKGNCPSSHLDTIHNTRDAVIALAQKIVGAVKNQVFLTYCPCHGILISNKFTEEFDGFSPQETLELWLQDMLDVVFDWNKNVNFHRC